MKKIEPPNWAVWSHIAKYTADEAAALTMNFCPKAVAEIQWEISRSGSPALFALVAGTNGMSFKEAEEFEQRLLLLKRKFESMISKAELIKFAEAVGWNLPTEFNSPAESTTELKGKEKLTALKLIGGMAKDGYGIDIHANRLTGIADLRTNLAVAGVNIDEDTLSKWLKLAAEVIDRPSDRKTPPAQ